MIELSRSDVFLKLSLGSAKVAVDDMEILTVQTGFDVGTLNTKLPCPWRTMAW
jgi:hypothetical protein